MSSKEPQPAPQGPKPPASPAPPPLKRFPGTKPSAEDLCFALADATPQQIRAIRIYLGLEPDS